MRRRKSGDSSTDTRCSLIESEPSEHSLQATRAVSYTHLARRARVVLDRVELVRVNDRVLTDAGALLPANIRSLDAIHLATALLLGEALGQFVTYDGRLASACRVAGIKAVAPS